MTEHIAAFAEILNSIETHKIRTRIVADRIMRIYDDSDDVPGEIATLLSVEFDRLAGRARP